MTTDLIVLNYCNFNDTFELFESLRDNDIDKINNIIVVDNDSPNDSFEALVDFFNASPEAIEYKLDRVQLIYSSFFKAKRVFLLKTMRNYGFAGGNNVGIRFSLLSSEVNSFLICNNDITFTEGSVEYFVDEGNAKLSEGAVGLVGSVLYYYDEPFRIQATGGILEHKYCRTKHLDCNNTTVSDRTLCDYPIGAVLLMSRTIIDKIGLLSEDYFLYFEELDYVFRMKEVGFDFCILDGPKVLHKEGGSAGSDSISYRKVSIVSDFYLNINKFTFTKKYNRKYLWIIIFVLIFNSLRRLCRMEPTKAINIIKFLMYKNYEPFK